MPSLETNLMTIVWRRRFGLLVGGITAIIVLVTAALAISLVPADWLAPMPWLGRLREWIGSESFPAYIAPVELVLLLSALTLAAYHFRHERASRFIERFNSPEIISMRGRIDDWLAGYDTSTLREAVRERGESVPDDERLRLGHLEARLLLELQRDPSLDKIVKAFANLFQEVGEAYENRTVSPSYTRRMFDFLAPHYWKMLRFWVEDYRLRGSPTLYARFGMLAKAIEEDPKKLARLRQEEARRQRNADRPDEAGHTRFDPTSFAVQRRAMLVEASRPQRALIFGYGSLIASRSRQHATSSQGKMKTAALHGFVRAWNTVDHVRFADEEEPSPVLFLGLALARNGACNGVLAPVDASELRDMDRREKDYLRIDVTPWIEIEGGEPNVNAAIYTYVGRPEFTYDPLRDIRRWEDLCVAGGYVQLLEEGLRDHSTEFAEAFRLHTWPMPPGIEVRNEPYRFLDPVQNRATGRDRPAADGGPATVSPR